MTAETPLYPWLTEPWRTLGVHLESGRVPQALLIHGPAGVGKALLAEAFAQKLLCGQPAEFACGQCPGCRLFLAGTHPDFIRVQPAEPGKAINVDAIRHLIDGLALKSQYSGYRVVIVAPAHQMNLNASNALLKTLEEPAERTIMLLLTESPSALPATILSRCQKLPVPMPNREAVHGWLEKECPGAAADVLLAAAEGSPLKALALAGSEVVDRRRAVFAECAGLLRGQLDPVAVAERWQGEPHEQHIDWMISWAADLARMSSAGDECPLRNPDLRGELQVLAYRLDLYNLFEHWSLLLKTRR